MTVTRQADLIVVGAGPAGCAAAITAVRAGQDVVMIDRATFPRDKTCGDGLTTEALRVLESLGLPGEALAGSAKVHDVMLVTPTGRIVELPLPRDGEYARVMARLDLDAALVAHARSLGVTIIEGCELTGLAGTADGVNATAADGTAYFAPYAIAADGNYSSARRLLTPDAAPVLGEWSAFRQYFCGVNDDRLWVIFERDLLPGYAWVFPLPDGRANVGLAMPRAPGMTGKVFARRWRELLDQPSLRSVLGPSAQPEGPHRAWPIPSHLDPERLVVDRVMFAGDAAGVVDPMTGEGIAQALISGGLAADATCGADNPMAVAARYRKAVECALGRDLRFAARLQRVLAHPTAARAVFRTVDLNGWTRAKFARWMFEDYPRALLLTPTRWRRPIPG